MLGVTFDQCLMLQPPLVGNEAPDFLAQAVFDQEFVEVSLSQYRVSSFFAATSRL